MHKILMLFVAGAILSKWPLIAPLTKSIPFADASRAAVTISIVGTSGSPVYALSCYAPDAQPDGNDFLYDGDFECRLTEAQRHESLYTLLTENPNQTRDWESRARFFARELLEPCGRVPEFGRSRTFLLRGMQLNLQIAKPEFDSQHRLRSFTLVVSARNSSDPAAQGEIASSPVIPRKWANAPCKLDNSVTPKFASG